MSDKISIKKAAVIAAFTAAASLGASSINAEGEMEKCMVVDEDGRGLIKAQKADCAGATHSCAGQNFAGDPEAWIYVPEGHCAKINAGDFEGVSEDIISKLELEEEEA